MLPWRAVSVPPGTDGRADVVRVLSQERGCWAGGGDGHCGYVGPAPPTLIATVCTPTHIPRGDCPAVSQSLPR